MLFRVLLRGNYVHFGINLVVVVATTNNPAFSLVCKLPFLKTFELVTLGVCPGDEFICLPTTETRKGQFKKELQLK